MDIFGDDFGSSTPAQAPTIMEATPAVSLEDQLGDVVEKKVVT